MDKPLEPNTTILIYGGEGKGTSLDPTPRQYRRKKRFMRHLIKHFKTELPYTKEEFNQLKGRS